MFHFLRRFSRARARFAAACGGNVALIFGLTLPVLIGIAGLGIDSAAITNQRSKMQSAADSTALAVGKEMNLSLDSFDPLKQSGKARAEVLLAELGIANRPHNVDITFDKEKASTHVEITMQTNTFLPAEVWGENPIVVDAVANTLGTKLCVLSLKQDAKDALALAGLARVNAPDCAVQSNSKDPAGLSAKLLSLLTSSYTCSSGGYEGDLSVFVPPPETDCPTVDDPLELRQPPTVGGCDFDGLTIKISQTIAPGHYCGGLRIKNGAEVTAEPGVYIISGGPLEVKNSASLKGDGVGFYFDDDAATFDFKNHAVVELSGPTSGPLAGLLFFENPHAKEDRDFKISSDKARKLIGTIYLPRGTLKANAKLDETVTSLLDPLRVIGQASTYTIIVANGIELDGVNLVINADYAASDVPVPSGLGPKSNKVRLVK
jgi:Flp pilus assembly protein TadG